MRYFFIKVLCLDAFPIAETTGFVDKLFECLTTKNYLGNPPPKEVPKEEPKLPVLKQEPVEVRAFLSVLCRIMSLSLIVGIYLANYCFLKAENLEEDRGDNRRRRSPLRNRSDLNESR